MPKPEDFPDDDPRDEDESESSRNSFGTGILIAIVTIIVILFIVGGALRAFPTPVPPGTPSCSTTCVGFLRMECPGNREMGFCLGLKVCEPPTHACGVNPPPWPP